MIEKYIRRDLKDFKNYSADFINYKVKLDANESPYSLCEEMKVELCNWIKESENLNIYPDTDCSELREELAKFWTVEKENVICGVGSDQLIDCILKLFIEVNDKVMMPTPSFAMYKISTVMNHGIPCEFDLNNDYSYDTEKIIEHYKKLNPKVLILCTPNNPTGNKMDKGEMKKVLENVKCPVIVDEAYGEFNDETVIDLIKQYDNLIILRTFSKIYGLAGLRVGYGISNSKMIHLINVTKPPYNLNTFSQIVAVQVLKNKALYEDRGNKIMEEKKWLEEELKLIRDIEIFKSSANFILIKSPVNNLGDKLKEKGILIRSFKGDDKLNNCHRISIGLREENEILIKGIKELYDNE